MPLPIILAHKLVRRLTEVRENGIIPYLRPDGKSQVTVEYDNTGKPVKVTSVVLSAQHDEEVKVERLREDIRELVIDHIIPEELRGKEMKCHINPTGKFVQGGPVADTGVTGRKIMVDTYGGFARHGGGCFSGKDPTKVDRSAAYMARYIAKNIVRAGIARRVEVQLAYAIGVADPVAIYVETFGTSRFNEDQIARAIKKMFNLTPRGIIEQLDLLKPIYYRTSVYGHFGREEEGFTWELTDTAKDLLEIING
jgi:S-adenosylmethionine synthetase